MIMEVTSNIEMNTELVCVMASIGYADGEDYFKGVDCLESLKDMIRFLRHEDLKTCNIRRQMGHSKVLENDILPLLVNYPDDKDLVDIVMRLLVNLTSAPHLCFEENMDDINKIERKAHELQMISYLQSYKEAFSVKSAMSTIGSHLGRILQLDTREREEEDNLLLERILLLIRNLLYVPANPAEEKRTDDDVTVHDQLLWNLHINGIDDLLIYLASSSEEGNWCMHALEIISYIIREQNAEELARTNENRSVKEKEEDTKKVEAILVKEKAEKNKQLDFRGVRHSRFGGSFWVKNVKGLNPEEDLVYHRPLQSTKDLTYDFDKNPEKKRITKRPLQDVNKERRSTISVRMFLKEFCVKFLEHGYNNLMSAVKSNLDAGRAQKHDESYFITVMRFFMAFNRAKSFRIEYVSQTFGVSTFRYIQHLSFRYQEMYATSKAVRERERKLEYARRLKLSVAAYKELLIYIAIMMKGNDEDLRKAANVIQSNIFYTEEYRIIFIVILKSWNPVFQANSFLKDVIEAFHLFLKLFETFLKAKGTFLTQTKRSKKAKKKKAKKQTERCPIEITADQADTLWQDTISVELSACIQERDERIPNDLAVPFDPVSDVPIDEQKLKAMAIIQRCLRCNRVGKAIAYLRSSRDCWPDEQKFGTTNMSDEEEFMCLRAIFFMELSFEILQQADSNLRTDDVEEEIEEEIAEEEEEMVEPTTTIVERQFDIKSLFKLLANPYIVKPYCYLLKFFKENSAHTNHCIIKMLHRIAVDLQLYGMLFQLSLFITFKKILGEENVAAYKEMQSFTKFILSKFFELYEKNPMVVVEMIRWKTSADCYEMTEGYGSLESARNKSDYGGKWTFEEEEELIDLHDQFKNETDAIEKIVQNITGNKRTAKQVTNKLVRLKLLEKPKKPKANEWTKEETEELRRIFEEFKNTDDPLGNIMNALSFSKAKKWIVTRLLDIGLVSDRPELHKKRRKKSKLGEMFEAEEQEDDLLIDEDDVTEARANMLDSDQDHSEAEFDNDGDDNDVVNDDDDDVSPNATMSEIIHKLVDLGFSNQIEWVQGRLRRLMRERESSNEDEWQSVPLVPITEEHENALASRLFMRMLKRVGISPPANEQETFWRISHTLSPQELKSFSDDLDKPAKDGPATRKHGKESSLTGHVSDANHNALHGNGSRQGIQAASAKLDSDDDDDYFERFVTGVRNPENASAANNDVTSYDKSVEDDGTSQSNGNDDDVLNGKECETDSNDIDHHGIGSEEKGFDSSNIVDGKTSSLSGKTGLVEDDIELDKGRIDKKDNCPELTQNSDYDTQFVEEKEDRMTSVKAKENENRSNVQQEATKKTSVKRSHKSAFTDSDSLDGENDIEEEEDGNDEELKSKDKRRKITDDNPVNGNVNLHEDNDAEDGFCLEMSYDETDDYEN